MPQGSSKSDFGNLWSLALCTSNTLTNVSQSSEGIFKLFRKLILVVVLILLYCSAVYSCAE